MAQSLSMTASPTATAARGPGMTVNGDGLIGSPRQHPRTLGWIRTTALAMGGSNQSLFIIGALFVGQGDIAGQGSAAVGLLIAGLLLAWAAGPGWTELVLMYPNRVGGIAASCAEAFRPYSPVLANLTGVCYWWGWIPTCGLTAILSASAIHQWYLPDAPVPLMATALVLIFALINLLGVKWVGRLAVPIASASALMALVSGLAPIFSGTVDWHQATTLHLTSPFAGWFGNLTSLMAGLYLVGFAAPAYEAAACHVGETIDPNRNVPRAMLASGAMAGVFFLLLPAVWLGTLGAAPLGVDLAMSLGPTFAPVFGSAAKAAAIWFMVLAMFSGTLQPLAGASRTLSQLSEDGLLPRSLALRNAQDVPWIATLLTAGMATLFLWIGDPIWLVAAANFTYLISIALPSVAVWLLRRDEPTLPRPYRAPRGSLNLGLAAAVIWGCSALLGFEQFGLPTVVIGLMFAYSGSALYAWRLLSDRRRSGQTWSSHGLQLKLTVAMLLVLLLDGTGYLLAVTHLPQDHSAMLTGLSDIFVAVAMLSITVALVLPGMIGHSAKEVSDATRRLVSGTLSEFSRAMQALGRGDLDAAHARVDVVPVRIRSRDEVGEMAASFNLLQYKIGAAATGLGHAREGLRQARDALTGANSSLRQRLEQLHAAEDKLAGILESIDNMVWSIDAKSYRLTYVNPAIERIYGRPAARFHDDAELWLKTIHPDDQQTLRHWLSQLGNADTVAVHYRIVRPDGQLRWLESRARRINDATGQPLRIDGVSTDISERKAHDSQLNHLARHDALTGLPNRFLLRERIEQAFADSAIDGRSVAALFLDLDGFKFINDSFGHTLGDALLVAVAQRLQSAVESDDTVARLGGDEFVILLQDSDGMRAATAMARRLIALFAEPLDIGGHSFHVTTSIGISIGPQRSDNAESLLKHADLAMYRSKQAGQGGFRWYAPEMGRETDERMEMDLALREAIAHNQFELYYEPQIDVASGRITGVEALIRWNHPQHGRVAPGRFIPLAEEIGLIVPLGEWVLRSACEQMSRWHAAGLHGFTMAINVSPRQFHQQDIRRLVAYTLVEAGLQPSAIELELTESGLMLSPETAADTLSQLRELGVGLAMDDFGTGYSSLSNLKRFPVDVLKIDRSFVSDLSAGGDAASIVRAVIAIAQSLNLRTVAEGVERLDQLLFLAASGCTTLQGHYFGQARPAAEMTELLECGYHPNWRGNIVTLDGQNQAA